MELKNQLIKSILRARGGSSMRMETHILTDGYSPRTRR